MTRETQVRFFQLGKGKATREGNWSKAFTTSVGRAILRDAAGTMQWERRVQWAYYDSLLGSAGGSEEDVFR